MARTRGQATIRRSVMDTAETTRERQLPEMIAAMARSEFYPERPKRVELMRTHVSYVFLTDAYVYKVKRAVRFPFIDSSSLEQRRHLCHEELRLNRRLAPHVYLGVVPIRRAAKGFVLGEPEEDESPINVVSTSDAIEYAVLMRRLPGEAMLDRRLERHAVDAAEIRAIAVRLAAFHLQCSTARAWEYGCAKAVEATVSANLGEMGQFVGEILAATDLDVIARHTYDFIESNRATLDRRAREGHVREGHGDLRCEHICLIDQPTVFDCVEFSAALRYGDVASDIGFLAMDLDRFAEPGLSEELIGAYAAAYGDRDLGLALSFYKCYRAMVRAKIEGLRSRDRDLATAERMRLIRSAREYIALARRYVERPPSPALMIVFGLSGSGKSTLAQALSRRLGFEIVSSDVVRKRGAGLAPAANTAAPYQQGIYSPDVTRRTYESLMAGARDRLSRGRGVILDATFGRRAHRGLAIAVAEEAKAPILFVQCVAPHQVALARIATRARQSGGSSDADQTIYQRQLRDFEPADEIPEALRIAIDTSNESSLELNKILQIIKCDK